ncbi:UAP56-interacting factor isoform X1 [Onychostruthus taczanowskii]|uniref:UAP56-interacting factor isoform X1 n=1 Tax=Onychostruthus taczanowskii TaxID=356909 RepID=UPI001B808DDD|nr:UAP56-interacting factor isoform X1 [Onychostruthus taczanowskii]
MRGPDWGRFGLREAAMNAFGAAAPFPGSSAAAGARHGGGESVEKIDMSLDDIIKLNKKEERKQYSPKIKRGLQQNRAQQFSSQGSKWGMQQQKGRIVELSVLLAGYGKNRLARRKKIAGKKRSYGVITGLAARKAVGSHKGVSPLNRQPLSEKNAQRNYPVLKRKTNLQRQSEMQRKQAPALRRPALLNRRNNMPSTFVRIGNKLNQQKDTRQATFLFRRGLKVQAQVQSTDDLDNQTGKRTRQWRTSTTSGGILTVSIDNPGAITSPVSQKLRLTRSPVPPFLMKRDQSEEKKIPKGVPLQFDINSVGKQTGMTLNERFGILKEQRTALSQNKGSRFVTVG